MILGRLLRRALRIPVRDAGALAPVPPVAAYDLWASTYDRETDNLLIVLDERVFGDLLRDVPLQGRVIADVGCGTGRHWPKILAGRPTRLVGFDLSSGMLNRLRAKYPDAEAHRVNDHRLAALPDASCDVVICTLALCHVAEPAAALAEWSRVLKPGGDVIVTDFHPEAAARGACTFVHEGRLIAVEVHAHSLDSLRQAAGHHGLAVLRCDEETVDDATRPFFDARNAAAVFARMKGIPLLYGIHLRKRAPV